MMHGKKKHQNKIPCFGSRLCFLFQARCTEADPTSEMLCFSVLKNLLDNG